MDSTPTSAPPQQGPDSLTTTDTSVGLGAASPRPSARAPHALGVPAIFLCSSPAEPEMPPHKEEEPTIAAVPDAVPSSEDPAVRGHSSDPDALVADVVERPSAVAQQPVVAATGYDGDVVTTTVMTTAVEGLSSSVVVPDGPAVPSALASNEASVAAASAAVKPHLPDEDATLESKDSSKDSPKESEVPKDVEVDPSDHADVAGAISSGDVIVAGDVAADEDAPAAVALCAADGDAAAPTPYREERAEPTAQQEPRSPEERQINDDRTDEKITGDEIVAEDEDPIAASCAQDGDDTTPRVSTSTSEHAHQNAEDGSIGHDVPEDVAAAPTEGSAAEREPPAPVLTKTKEQVTSHVVVPLAQWLRPHAGPDALLTGDTMAKYNASLVETLREFDVDVTGIAPLPCGETSELPRPPGSVDPMPFKESDPDGKPVPFLPITIPAFVQCARDIYCRAQGPDSAMWPKLSNLFSALPTTRTNCAFQSMFLVAVECGLISVLLPTQTPEQKADVHDGKITPAALRDVFLRADVVWTPELCDFDRVRPLRPASKPLQQRPAFAGSFITQAATAATGSENESATTSSEIQLSADVILVALTDFSAALTALSDAPVVLSKLSRADKTRRTKRPRSRSHSPTGGRHDVADSDGFRTDSDDDDGDASVHFSERDRDSADNVAHRRIPTGIDGGTIDYAAVAAASPSLRYSAGRGSLLMFVWMRSTTFLHASVGKTSASHFSFSEADGASNAAALGDGQTKNTNTNDDDEGDGIKAKHQHQSHSTAAEQWLLDVTFYRNPQVSRFDAFSMVGNRNSQGGLMSGTLRRSTFFCGSQLAGRCAVLAGGIVLTEPTASGVAYPIDYAGETSRDGKRKTSLFLKVRWLSNSPHYHNTMSLTPQQIEEAFPKIPTHVTRHAALVAFKVLYQVGGLVRDFDEATKKTTGQERGPDTYVKHLTTKLGYTRQDAVEALTAAVSCGVLRLNVKGSMSFVTQLSPCVLLETALVKAKRGSVLNSLSLDAAKAIADIYPPRTQSESRTRPLEGEAPALVENVPEKTPDPDQTTATPGAPSAVDGGGGENAIVLRCSTAMSTLSPHVKQLSKKAKQGDNASLVARFARLSLQHTDRFLRPDDAFRLLMKARDLKVYGRAKRGDDVKALCDRHNVALYASAQDTLILVPREWRDLVSRMASLEKMSTCLRTFTEEVPNSSLLRKMQKSGEEESGPPQAEKVKSDKVKSTEKEKSTDKVKVPAPKDKTAFTFEFGGEVVKPFPATSLVLQGSELHKVRRQILNSPLDRAGAAAAATGTHPSVSLVTSDVLELAKAGLENGQRFMCLVDLIQLVSERIPSLVVNDRLVDHVTDALVQRHVDVRQWPGASLLTFVMPKSWAQMAGKNNQLSQTFYGWYNKKLRPAGIEVRTAIKNGTLPHQALQEAEKLRAAWVEFNRNPRHKLKDGPPRGFQSALQALAPAPQQNTAHVQQPPHTQAPPPQPHPRQPHNNLPVDVNFTSLLPLPVAAPTAGYAAPSAPLVPPPVPTNQFVVSEAEFLTSYERYVLSVPLDRRSTNDDVFHGLDQLPPATHLRGTHAFSAETLRHVMVATMVYSRKVMLASERFPLESSIARVIQAAVFGGQQAGLGEVMGAAVEALIQAGVLERGTAGADVFLMPTPWPQLRQQNPNVGPQLATAMARFKSTPGAPQFTVRTTDSPSNQHQHAPQPPPPAPRQDAARYHQAPAPPAPPAYHPPPAPTALPQQLLQFTAPAARVGHGAPPPPYAQQSPSAPLMPSRLGEAEQKWQTFWRQRSTSSAWEQARIERTGQQALPIDDRPGSVTAVSIQGTEDAKAGDISQLVAYLGHSQTLFGVEVGSCDVSGAASGTAHHRKDVLLLTVQLRDEAAATALRSSLPPAMRVELQRSRALAQRTLVLWGPQLNELLDHAMRRAHQRGPAVVFLGPQSIFGASPAMAAARDDALAPMTDLFSFFGRCCVAVVDGCREMSMEVLNGSGSGGVPAAFGGGKRARDDTAASPPEVLAVSFTDAARGVADCHACLAALQFPAASEWQCVVAMAPPAIEAQMAHVLP